MADLGFGSDSGPFESIAEGIAKNLESFTKETGEKPNHIAKNILLRKVYESGFGIHQHFSEESKKRPLGLYVANKADELFLYSSLARDMGKFIEIDVYKYTGVSWDKFKELPYAEADLLYKMAKRKMESDVKTDNAAVGELKEQLGKLKNI